jgi:ABC-type amino acid transport substrate-binding protein
MNAGGKKVLRVGIDDAPPVPMQMGRPEAGDFRGYEVDLLERVAERLGFTIAYRRALWSVIVGELVKGELDLVCSAATVTAAREKEVDFCTPHLRLALALVTRDGLSAHLVVNPARMGVRKGTTAEAYLLQWTEGRAAAMQSESNEELYTALSRGELDAVIDDSPIAMHFSRAVPGLRYAGAFDHTECAYAVMVRRGDTRLREQINETLAQLEGEGILPGMRKVWFGSESLLIA